MISDAHMLCLESRPSPIGGLHKLEFCSIKVYERTPAGAVQVKLDSIPAPLLPFFTRWVAQHGGKPLMDVWEVEVINSSHSELCPIDPVENLIYRKSKGWHVDWLFRENGAIRLEWVQEVPCQLCADVADDPEPEQYTWGCPWCGGTGKVDRDDLRLVTDIEGTVIHATEQEHAA